MWTMCALTQIAIYNSQHSKTKTIMWRQLIICHVNTAHWKKKLINKLIKIENYYVSIMPIGGIAADDGCKSAKLCLPIRCTPQVN